MSGSPCPAGATRTPASAPRLRVTPFEPEIPRGETIHRVVLPTLDLRSDEVATLIEIQRQVDRVVVQLSLGLRIQRHATRIVGARERLIEQRFETVVAVLAE